MDRRFRRRHARRQELTATVIYIHVDANTFTWQSVDQAVDGQPIADTQPIKVTKQKRRSSRSQRGTQVINLET